MQINPSSLTGVPFTRLLAHTLSSFSQVTWLPWLPFLSYQQIRPQACRAPMALAALGPEAAPHHAYESLPASCNGCPNLHMQSSRLEAHCTQIVQLSSSCNRNNKRTSLSRATGIYLFLKGVSNRDESWKHGPDLVANADRVLLVMMCYAFQTLLHNLHVKRKKSKL